LQQIQTASGPAELDLTLAYYLNNLRSNSTLLGTSQPVQPNYYAARNVRAWADLRKVLTQLRTLPSM